MDGMECYLATSVFFVFFVGGRRHTRLIEFLCFCLPASSDSFRAIRRFGDRFSEFIESRSQHGPLFVFLRQANERAMDSFLGFWFWEEGAFSF
jgi:hypothetical protein